MTNSYERHILPLTPELSRAALRLTRSPAAADDLVQDALTRAWSAWSSFQQGTNHRAWVHRILFNTYVNHYRRRKREREAMAELRGNAPPLRAASPAVENGLSDEVLAAVDSLHPDFRRAIQLVDIGGLSYQDAARTLACPVGTVMSRLHRARRALREQLHGYAVTEGYIATAA